MGLSNEERFAGVAHSINGLYKLRGLTEYGFEDLNELLGQLWYTFLGDSSNSLHWIIGSESGQSHFRDMGLLSLSFDKWAREMRKDPDSCIVTSEDLRERLRGRDEEAADFFDYLDQFSPTAVSLLNHKGRDYGKVWEILKRIEHFFYYANRYEDDLSRRLEPVARVICEIRGRLFDLMLNRRVFFQAFMMERILDRILMHDPEDVVTQLFRKQNMHHDVRVDSLSDTATWEAFKQAQKKPLQSANERMLILLEILGRRNHYDHQHRELVTEIKAWNKANKKDKIDLKAVKKLLKRSKKLYKKHGEEERSYPSYCVLTEQEV